MKSEVDPGIRVIDHGSIINVIFILFSKVFGQEV